jgi:Helicase conserved C-terminal domain
MACNSARFDRAHPLHPWFLPRKHCDRDCRSLAFTTAQLAREILLEVKHRPAIVYTPTRKQVDSLAEDFAGELDVASYHSGLDAERRRRVQEQFMAGKLAVIVATHKGRLQQHLYLSVVAMPCRPEGQLGRTQRPARYTQLACRPSNRAHC